MRDSAFLLLYDGLGKLSSMERFEGRFKAWARPTKGRGPTSGCGATCCEEG